MSKKAESRGQKVEGEKKRPCGAVGLYPPVCLVVLATWLGGMVGCAQAQLGETPQAVAKTYGAPVRRGARIWQRQIYDGHALDGDLYEKRGLYLRALFRHDKVELLEFTRLNGALSQKEVDALLAASAEGSRWEMGKDSTDAAKFYARNDGRAIAHWAVGPDGSLLIVSENPGRVNNTKLLE